MISLPNYHVSSQPASGPILASKICQPVVHFSIRKRFTRHGGAAHNTNRLDPKEGKVLLYIRENMIPRDLKIDEFERMVNEIPQLKEVLRPLADESRFAVEIAPDGSPQLVTKNTHTLNLNPVKRLAAKFKRFQTEARSLGFDELAESLGDVVIRFPTVLTLPSLTGPLKSLVQLLPPPVNLTNVVNTVPAILMLDAKRAASRDPSLSFSKLEQKLILFQKIFGAHKALLIIDKDPRVLKKNAEKAMLPRVHILEEALQLSRSQVPCSLIMLSALIFFGQESTRVKYCHSLYTPSAFLLHLQVCDLLIQIPSLLNQRTNKLERLKLIRPSTDFDSNRDKV